MNQDGSFSLSTWITGMMCVGGLIAGPGNYLYSVYFSGKSAGEYALQRQGSSYGPIALQLEPSMNPIVLQVKAYVPRNDAGMGVSVRVAVEDGPTRLSEGSARFEGARQDGGGYQSVTLDRFSVERSGRYTVRFQGGVPGGADVRLSNLRLEVRRNVREPDMKTVWWGLGFLVAGLVIGIFTGDTKPVERGPRSR